MKMLALSLAFVLASITLASAEQNYTKRPKVAQNICYCTTYTNTVCSGPCTGTGAPNGCLCRN